MAEIRRHVRHIGQRSFRLKFIVRTHKQTHIHAAGRLHHLDHKAASNGTVRAQQQQQLGIERVQACTR